jgi:predicted Zn-dependent peptidase
MYSLSHLPNGLTVATAEMGHMSSVSLGIWVAVGGRHEPASINGVSHFIEHMLFKGTRRRSAKAISEDVEGIGGYLNAFTTEENTCFYSKGSQTHFGDLWDVLADMFLNSTFAKEELTKERNVIKEELAMYLDQPHHHVQELLNETLWPDQPLGRPLTGTEQTLDRMRREELMRYMRANYGSSSTLIAAAGAIGHKDLLNAVKKVAPRFPKAPRAGFTPAVSDQDGPRVRLHTKTVEQTQLALGIRTCSRHDERRYALRILNVILGENMSSRLFQTIREDHGLAYSICSSVNFFDDTGAFTISAGLETDKALKTLKLVIAELAKIARHLPSPGEVRRARDYIFGQLDLSLENTENQMMWLGEQYLGYGKVIPPDEVKQHLAQVTPSQVRASARDFFRADRLSLALVTPLKDAAPFEKVLSGIAG